MKRATTTEATAFARLISTRKERLLQPLENTPKGGGSSDVPDAPRRSLRFADVLLSAPQPRLAETSILQPHLHVKRQPVVVDAAAVDGGAMATLVDDFGGRVAAAAAAAAADRAVARV